MTRRCWLLPLVMAALSAHAQVADRPLRKFVVADAETRVPMRDVVVSTKDGYRDTTNYRGICYIPVAFDTLSVKKHGYLTERLLPKEIKDSTFLIPNNRRISEVTVWGKDGMAAKQESITEQVRRQMRENMPIPNGASAAFDLGRMLDKRYRKDMKHLKKTRQLFQKMDETDEDPIVRAYKKALEKKRIEAEEQKKKAPASPPRQP